MGASSGRARPTPTCWPRAGSSRRRPWPTRATSTGPSPCWPPPGASKALRNPSERHVRQWYLLADLYERAGDVPKAREYFERVFRTDPEAYDVAERLRGLGPERRPRPRRTKTSTSTKTGPPAPKG